MIAKMALSREDARSIAIIARDASSDPGLHGLLGPAGSLRAFADASGRQWRDGRGTTIYDCRTVVEPSPGVGSRRVAERADRALVARWVEAFMDEAFPEERRTRTARRRRTATSANGTCILWTVGDAPVACAAAVGADAERNPHRRSVHAAGKPMPADMRAPRRRPHARSTRPWTRIRLLCYA